MIVRITFCMLLSGVVAAAAQAQTFDGSYRGNVVITKRV
jgi:hypothetical protein